MEKNNLHNKTIYVFKNIIIGISFIFIVLTICLNNNVNASEPNDFNITIIYQNETEQIISNALYKPSLKSVILADYDDTVDGQFYGWTPTTLIDGIYEHAFAGWQLVKINNDDVEKTYFYPDNDFIYSNDQPFNDYNFSETISLTFKPIYGKRIYLRDEYNFKNLNDVFGDNIATAKIDWDGDETGETGKKYAYSIKEANASKTDEIENVGSSVLNPVSNIADAVTLLGTTGGEIVTVNHYTLKNSDNKYNYYDGKQKSGAYNLYLGKKVTKGVITYTGLNYGLDPVLNGNEEEKAEEKRLLISEFYPRYKNAHWYCLNTRGNKGNNGHSFNLYFACDSVLEGINLIGYRESYKDDGSRSNGQVYLNNSANKRFVVMESFDQNQRKTSEKLGGFDSTNWGYSSYVKDDRSLNGLTRGGKGFLQLYTGYNAVNNGLENIYITLHGNKSDGGYLDGTYHYNITLKNSSGTAYTDANVNNIHVYMKNFYINSDYKGIEQGLSSTFKCNSYITYLFNIRNSSSAGYMTTVHNTKYVEIKDLKVVIDGDDSTQKLLNTYIGGMLETSGGSTSTVNITNAEVSINNNASISNLHGGGNQFAIATIITNSLTINVNGGKIDNLYGGCQGGMITASDININVNGGTIDNLYGGGAGGLVNCYDANSPTDLTKYTYSNDYKYFAYEKSSSNSNAVHIAGVSIGLEEQVVSFGENSQTYDVLTFYNLYPDGAITAINDYYNAPKYICITNALVTTNNGIHININGGSITNDVYGGGLSGSVESDIYINIADGKIGGNLYGGGSGKDTEFSAKSFFKSGNIYNDFKQNKYDIKYTANKNALNTEKLNEILLNSTNTVYQNQISFLKNNGFNDTFISNKAKKVFQSSDFDKMDILTTDKNGNKFVEVYSNVVETLGSIKGNTSLNIDGGQISGNVFGGSDGAISKITGSTNVNILSGTILGKVYGGGNVAAVTENSNVTIKDVTISEIFGGGNVGSINGSTSVEIAGNANITNVYAGCNQANVGNSTNLIINDGSIINIYGGNNLNGTITTSISTIVNGGNITNVYGGGNEANALVDTNVLINGGNITSLFGGGKNADVKNVYLEVCELVPSTTNITNIYGGGYKGRILENSYINFNGGTIIQNLYGGGFEGNLLGGSYIYFNDGLVSNNLFGGGYEGNVLGNSYIEFKSGVIGQNLYGGGYQGTIDDNSIIIVDYGTINNIYGGGYAGYVLGSTEITVNNGTINYNIYGGGYQGKVANNTTIEFNDGVVNNIYGGGFEGNVEKKSNIVFNNGEVINDIFGGGYLGAVNDSNISISNGIINGNVYGGGYSNDVNNNVILNVNGSTINKNIYGGGYAGDVIGDTFINFYKGTVLNNIYGGGFIGTVNNTSVVVLEESSKYGDIKIYGNIFGGGYGLTATVYETTNVSVNLNLNQTVEEKLITTSRISEASSGESAVEVSFVDGYSFIDGSIYGGGDLGQIGIGIINTSNNTATVSKCGRTNVLLLNGYIGGSVFGGGSGIPKEDTYQLEMGTIYGSTKVTISGGYINKNVYGGGTQSRVYFSNLNDSSITLATDVSIEENEKPIVINGSVFGGGDRGNSATTNASVHTTIGNVKVSINGNSLGSQIYFVTGGVYGDGNLCLVKGERVIELNNFTTGKEYLKTFRSLQRANTVKLNNSDIVLLGAVDLVEEGDNTVYSINRINTLLLENGSTVKLDQIVKYLGQIESDYEFLPGDNTPNRKFIDAGNNGTNGYTSLGGSNPIPLTDDEIEEYRLGESVSNLKNIICVANGLYLEILNEDNQYGMVKGLFTLQLLRANEGEGGGFVYASIESSIGTFICETKYGPTKLYMSIVGNVSGFSIDKYTYYCWFIQGDTINYQIDVEGYIGSDQVSYKESSIIPEHTESLYYILNYIKVNQVLTNAITENKYQLVQKNNNLIDQEIALELYIGSNSIGYLSYVDGIWYICDKIGYESNADNLITNLSSYKLGEFNIGHLGNELSIVLHKSKEVNAEIQNMQLEFEIDLYTDELQLFSNGTSKLIYSITFSIVRLVPEQAIYSGIDKMYSGLSESSIIKVTNGSSFTIEYQTRYIPIAFPKGMNQMYWVLSTIGYSYYMDELGNYLTLDQNGNVINISPLLTLDPSESSKVLVSKNAHGDYEYTHNSKKIKFELLSSFQSSYLPQGTKITMIDMSLEKSPTYYYYICEEDKTQINLNDFYVMGTKSLLGNMSKNPEFKNLYYNENVSSDQAQEATRITERLIFVFDLEQVDKTEYHNVIDNIYTGNVILNHLYGQTLSTSVDIMDFVKSEIKEDVRSYTRSTPKVVTYNINVEDTGIKTFDVEFNEVEYSENDVAEINILIEKNIEYTNTQLKNGKIGVKIKVSGDNNLPDGIEFRYNGVFLPKYGNKYLIVPILNYGNYTIEVVNNLGNIITNLELSKAMFEASLCYLPDEQYFNETVIKNTQIVDFDIECNITDEVPVSLTVTTTNTNISYGTTNFDIQVFEKNTTLETTLKVYYLDQGKQILTRDIYASKVIKGSNNGTINNLQISENIKRGIYLLVFNNGEKEVLMYIIIN